MCFCIEKCVYSTLTQPQNQSWAIVRHVMVPEALMEPAPAAATLAGCSIPLGLFHHPTAMHPAQVMAGLDQPMLAKGGVVALDVVV